jgi:hypothetical protein
MDGEDALVLSTDYETMSSVERFAFAGPDVRIRVSTVEGLSNTASFCIETRIVEPAVDAPPIDARPEDSRHPLALLGW